MDIQFTGVDDYKGTHWVVHRIITYDNGVEEEGVHIFPKDILETRAAEYGLSESDREELLDLILAEPYITDDEWKEGVHPGLARSGSEALVAHRTRCDKARGRMRIKKAKDRTKDHPLQTVLENSPLNPEAMRLKRKLIGSMRADQRRLSQMTPEQAEKERIKRLRRDAGEED